MEFDSSPPSSSIKEKWTNVLLVNYLLVSIGCALSLVLLVVVCFCCQPKSRRGKRKASGETTENGPKVETQSPVPTVISREYYKMHPSKIKSSTTTASQQRASSKMSLTTGSKKLDTSSMTNQQRQQLVKLPEIDDDYADKVMNDAAAAAAAAAEAAPSSRKNREQEWKEKLATSDKDKIVSKQKWNGSGVVTGARLRSDRSSSKSRRRSKSVEFASHDDPAYQTLGLDVDDPFDVRPLNPIVWSHPVKPLRKPANRLVVKQEKSSIFL